MKFRPAIKVIISSALIWLFSFLSPAAMARDGGNLTKQTQVTDYTVTISTAQTTIGSTLTVNWEAPEGHPASDYLRLAKVGDSEGTYNWSQAIGAASSGSFNVTIPNTVARYEFRLFRSSDNQRVAQSLSFVANKTDYSVTASPLTVPAGGQVAIDWNSPANSSFADRLVITSANNSTILSQQYTGGINPKTVRMTVPSNPGQYEIRYLEANFSLPSAISQTLTVESAAGSFAGQVKKGETGEYMSGALVEALQNNIVKATASTNSNGAYELPLALTGTYDLKVTAGNLPTVMKNSQILSNGATTIVDFLIYDTGSLNGKITGNGNGIAIPGATVQIKQGITLIAAATTDGSGNYAVPQLPPGTYSADISANGFTPASQSNVLITAGTTTILNSSLSAISGNSSGLEYVYDDGGRIVATKEQGVVKNIYNYDLSGNLLNITTPQGNTPYIISFSPSIGLPGTQVMIRGLNFSQTSGQNTINFNGANAAISSFSATEIVTSVPSGATTGTISVTTPNGTVVSVLPFLVETDTGDAPPAVSNIYPLAGHSGDMVTITGTNFESELSDNTVKIGANGTGILSGSTTSLQVKANTSSGKISVATPNGTAVSNQEFILVPPSIDVTKVFFEGRTWFGRRTNIDIVGDKLGVITFDGVAGKRFSVQSLTLNNNVRLDIYRPDGRLLSKNNFNAAASPDSWFIDTQTFPLTGTYTAIVTPLNTAMTTYTTLIIHDVPPDISDVIPINTLRTYYIITPGQNGLLTYNATAGQKILLRVTDSTSSGLVVMRRFNANAPNAFPSITNFSYTRSMKMFSPDGITIPATGTYTIELNPSGPDTGPMSVTLFVVPPDPVISMDIGTTASVTTTAEGQNAWLEFYGTTGQRISLQTRNVTYPEGFQISLNKPDGTFLLTPRRMTSGSFIDTLTLPANGLYKIYINPDGDYTGSALVDLFNVPGNIVGTTTINGSAVTATALVPGQNPTITFDALQGQQARVNVTNSNYPDGTQFRLKKPDGSIISNGIISSGSGIISSTTLPVEGNYAVEIDPSGIGLGTASISVGGDVSDTITPGGSSTTATINNEGQSAWFSFSGTAGQRVSLKVTSTTINTGTVSFRNPDGSVLGTPLQIGFNNNFLDTVTLPANGNYNVVVDPAGASTGSATMVLYNVPAEAAGTIIISGNSQTKTTTVPGQNLLLTFSGTSNQKITLEVSGVTIPNGTQIVVRKPDGAALISSGFGTSGVTISDIILPETGTFSIFVNPVNDDVGSVTLQLYGTGAGSNPNIQLWQSVAVQKGLASFAPSQISSSVSVKKGVVSGNDTNTSLVNSVSVRKGNWFGSEVVSVFGSSVFVTTGPVISNLSSGSAAKGTTLTLTIGGSNLSGTNAIRFYNSAGNADTNITATNISVNTAGTVMTATIQVSSSAALGERIMVVTTNSFGLSPQVNTGVNVLNITQ
jgi:YD repeat-containing protein